MCTSPAAEYDSLAPSAPTVASAYVYALASLHHDGKAMPGGAAVSMPVCDQDDGCSAFSDTGYLYNVPFVNETIDTYFSTKRCGNVTRGAAPAFVTGSCGHESTQYMSCTGVSFEVRLLVHYQLPPAVCATTCDNNPACSSFVSTKDFQWCELYEWTPYNSLTLETSYLKVSSLRLL